MFESIYRVLPVFLQNWACTLYGLLERRKRFSKHFVNYQLLMSKFDRAEFGELQLEQRARLVSILNFARTETNYYGEYIKQQVTLQNVETVLDSLPIVDKSTILKNPHDFESQSIKKVPFKTSGTSGRGFSFFKCIDAISSQWAVWFRHRNRFNVNEGDLHVNFMGKPLVPDNKAPFWRKNSAFNQYLIPMQVVSNENMREIVAFLNTISPRFYCGYPSILAEVARISIEMGLELEKSARPQFIFTGAEPLLENQKKLLEDWTGAVVSQQYGMSEGVCNVSECEAGNYHEDMEFGLIEKFNPVVNADGSITAEIVGTSFYNRAQPFIRYRTGDSATWEPEDYVCKCGRSSPVIRQIEGRIEDYVVLEDGRRIMRFDYLFKAIPEIEEAQVVQKKIGKIEIHYVSELETIDTGQILEKVCEFVDSNLVVDFIRVSRIEREPNGKFRSVKSHLR